METSTSVKILISGNRIQGKRLNDNFRAIEIE